MVKEVLVRLPFCLRLAECKDALIENDQIRWCCSWRNTDNRQADAKTALSIDLHLSLCPFSVILCGAIPLPRINVLPEAMAKSIAPRGNHCYTFWGPETPLVVSRQQ